LGPVPGSDHCPAMKGIETAPPPCGGIGRSKRSDHCPAMKGIETSPPAVVQASPTPRSDHCPAMKGIETTELLLTRNSTPTVKRPLPRNEGD